LAQTDEDPFTTLVHPEKSTTKKEVDFAETSSFGSRAEEQLQDIPELTLTRQGGPLAPTEIKMRGLGGPRFEVFLEGLNLADPVSGYVDAQDLPLFAIARASSSFMPSSSFEGLTLTLPGAQNTFARSSMGRGSFSTGKADLLGQAELGDSVSVLLGASLKTSQGSFAYEDPQTGDLHMRENNDQRRILSLGRIHWHSGRYEGFLTAIGRKHDAGLPGLAEFPSTNLRMTRIFVGTLLGFAAHLDSDTFTVKANTRFDSTSTTDVLVTNQSKTESLANSLEFESAHEFLNQAIQLDAGLKGDYVFLFREPTNRFTIDAFFRFRKDFERALKTYVETQLKFHSYSDLSPLVSGYVEAGFSATSFFDTAFKFARNVRPPSLAELYTPMGGILTNASLKSENGLTGEWIANLKWEPLQFQSVAFYSLMEEAIFYQPTPEGIYQPTNTGRIHRAGLETKLAIFPISFVSIDWKTKWLYSYLMLSGAELPNTPPFWTRAALTVFPSKETSASLATRYQSGSIGDFKGITHASPYTMLDANMRLSPYTGVQIFFELNNLMDIRWARDQASIPLPGRNFFIGLEVAS